MQIPGYQIEHELGQGGMAIVYLAIQESLRRPVALKVIKPVLTTDEEFAIRFQREGRLIAQLNDPHIVTVYDIASHDGTYYLSMEYLGGGTLQQRIRAGLSPSEVLIISRAIVGALSYAHERSIIHRDIKPQNILFRENGTPVLTDFGIAKTLGSNTIMTRTGLSIGTPRYMSPEQIRGQEVDPRADLYSFGVLFYEMLTGNVPYAAEDSFALAMMHVTAATPELPPRLSAYQPLLNKLLDKDPNRRFQRGQDFIAALDALEAGRTDELLRLTRIDSPTVGTDSRARRPRPFTWKTGMAVAAVVLVGTVAGSGTYLYLQQPTPPPLADSIAPPSPPATDTTAQQREAVEPQLIAARQQQQAGALKEALAHVEEGLGQAPHHAELLALREEINQQLAEARAQGEQQQQMELQAEQLLEQAQRAQQEDNLDISLVYIEQGLGAMPKHSGLLALKQEVLAHKTEREQQEESARQQVETTQHQEEQRQAEERRAEKHQAEQRQAEERQRQAEEFLARALDDQRNQAYESSLLQIEQGLQQVPKHPRLLALRTEVRGQLHTAKSASLLTPAEEAASRVTNLLRECNAHLRANRLTMGRGGNAADCYAEV
ncbi:MAG: protein kinase, partial [Phycisphaerales bacterium]|nr:protein kinase [Phycisphaerales bacterium]